METISPHHIALIERGYDCNYDKMRPSMSRSLLGAILYNSKTIEDRIKFFRKLSSDLNNRFIVGEPGEPDAVCELCCCYKDEQCEVQQMFQKYSHKEMKEFEANYLEIIGWKPGEVRVIKETFDLDKLATSKASALVKISHRLDKKIRAKIKKVNSK